MRLLLLLLLLLLLCLCRDFSLLDCCCRLGCPRVVLAPMVDQSELAFRQFCRQIGCRLAYSPMLHASVIVRSASADSTKLAEAPKSEFVTNTMNSTADSNQQSSDTVSVTQSAYLGTFFKTCREDRPLAIQLAGSSVQELSAAAGLVAHMCDIVDLNVGCPQAMVWIMCCFDTLDMQRMFWFG